jgi:hypothetical protein
VGKKKSRLDVLNYSLEGVDPGTVRAHYDEYLAEHDLPKRCEIPECQFHTGPLIWNGRPFTLILDHIDGCNTNNSIHNLRYICPNCNQQQPTNGGGNKGRIKDKATDGYAVQERGESRRVISRFLTTKWNIEDSSDGNKDEAPQVEEGGDLKPREEKGNVDEGGQK